MVKAWGRDSRGGPHRLPCRGRLVHKQLVASNLAFDTVPGRALIIISPAGPTGCSSSLKNRSIPRRTAQPSRRRSVKNW